MSKKNKKNKKNKKTPLQKKRDKAFSKRIIFEILYWVLLLTPISIFVGINHEDFITEKTGLSITIGAVIVLVCVLLVSHKRMTIFKGIGKYIVFVLVCYFLQSIMDYATWISLMVLIGYFCSMWFIKPIEHEKKLIEAIDKALINSEAMSETTMSVKVVKDED